jgi:3-carboxymethyl-3-hydroxy-acyl-[acp] dehydratase
VSHETIVTQFQGSVCFIKLNRPQDNNTITSKLVTEFNEVLLECDKSSTVVVISGSPEVFCLGADFTAIGKTAPAQVSGDDGPELLYDLWLKLATGPYVTIASVRGKANAGGVGFVAASDIVVADGTAKFSLSELLFGLYPALVLPFLVRRVGFQRAHYMTLTAQPISAKLACEWGLVDAYDEAGGEALLQRHLQRLRRLPKAAIRDYKAYVGQLNGSLLAARLPATTANREIFSNSAAREAIRRFVEQGLLPWEDP